MKLYVLLLALLQSLGGSGAPLLNSELEAMASRGIGAALTQVNSLYAVNHLYRVTQGTVTRVVPVGMNTVDMLMLFSIKETECAKASRNDPQTCTFRAGFFVPTFTCSSRVRMSASSTQVISVRCGNDGSSSSESSEEMLRGRHQFNIPLAGAAPSPPAQSSRSLQGSNLDNFLV